MQYRRLGRSGLQVSELSLGSWVTYANQVDVKAAKEMLTVAMDSGVNFFDNAEVYTSGKSESVMGDAIKALKWPRLNYVISTKFFWGLEEPDATKSTINRKNTLNRKYLMQAIDGSLQRRGLGMIDLVYCHRPDANTPIEETVHAMSDKGLTHDKKNAAVGLLGALAKEPDCTTGQLAIAWAAHNLHVSTVITGASKIEQLKANLGAANLIARLSPDVMARIDEISRPLKE